MRAGMLTAFESAIEGLPRETMAETGIADDLMRGLRRLPLLLS